MITTLEECEARNDCHSVFEDPGTCGCALPGCCARFWFCAPGDLADCEGKSVMCEAVTPHCESPAYVVSAMGLCYEGCVAPKDCAPACRLSEDALDCSCYTEADCAEGERCYDADCANDVPGTCRTPPGEGCFDDADCPEGQSCTGGLVAQCGLPTPDQIGTCSAEACADGDCSEPFGADCTCSANGDCVAATGPTANGLCRGDDGICFECECAAPDTPIATPSGERPIAELRPGDLVFSVDGEQIRAVPITRVNRRPVAGHRVLHVTFDGGRSIDMSATHPLADGRPLSALKPGDTLMGGVVVGVVSVPYQHAATYDILPASTTGAYFASGVLIGSTLASASLGQTAAGAK